MKLIYETSESNNIKFEQELNEATGQKKYRIKGIFSSPGIKNKNGRVYPMSIWEREVKRYQDVIKSGHPNSLMQLGHPPYTDVRMMEAVAKIDKLYIKDGFVMGEATLLNNDKANQLKSLIDAGIKMSVSTRGLGTVVESVVKDYKLITVDIIEDLGQSDYNAEMMGITEGVLLKEDFKIDESGNITKVCSEDGICHMFESEEVQDAIEEKFKNILSNLSEIKDSDYKLKDEFMKYVAKKYKVIDENMNSFRFKIGGHTGNVYFDN